MADVKIPVSASVKGVTDELTAVERKLRDVEKAADRLGRIKFHPIDADAIGRELKKLEQMMLDTHRRVQGSWNGGAGAGGGGGALSPSPATPRPAPSGTYPARPGGGAAGGGGGRGRGGAGAYTHAPGWGSLPQQFISGVGGGFSTIASYGARGAVAGAYGGGGAAGGGMGLLRGGLIGAAALGAYKIGSGISEGVDLAQDRSGTLDNLKRQLGDVGISFRQLKIMSEQAAQGLQLNSKEGAELAAQFNRMSRGAGGMAGLVDGTRTGAGLSRAYGLDPSAGVGFVAGMANMDRRQNNRELALLLAEAVGKSGMSARADEVMQAMMGYASSISRMVMGTGGLTGYAGAYGSLMGMHGMTSDNAAGILGAANSSVMRMGGAGEAGQNFTMMALSRYGRLNPVQAMALSEGGLFGSRGDVFGADSSISRFMGGAGMPGGDQSATNFSSLRKGIRGLGGDKWLQLDAAKRYFGVGSLSQAAALMNLDEGGAGALQSSLKRAGVDINRVNASGIQALAAAGPNATPDQLRALASANRESTQFTEMQDQTKALDDIKINTGDKLMEPLNAMRGYMAAIAGKLAPDSPMVKAEKNKKYAVDMGSQLEKFDAFTATMKPPEGMPKQYFEKVLAMRSRQRTAMVSGITAGMGASPELLQQISANEQSLGLAPGTLIQQIGVESGFNPTAVSSAGAVGLAQIMPGTSSALSKRAGRTLDPTNAQDAILMQKMLWQENLQATHGDVRKAAAMYHGGPDQSGWGPTTNAYADVVSTPLPDGHAAAPGGAAGGTKQVDISHTITVQNQDGKPIAAPLKTRVSVPRGSGDQ